LTDPIGPVGTSASAPAAARVLPAVPGTAIAPAEIARLHAGLERARELGVEAHRAAERSAGGGAVDVEGLLIATRQADAAFRMLAAVRNEMIEAYALAARGRT
jgi:flagellar hook-basal body complex protein FliE